MFGSVFSVLAATDPPAGGAAIGQVIIATAMGTVSTIVLLIVCLGHRSGRLGLLRWGSKLSRRLLGAPGWVGVPSGIALATLLPALFGLQWDESIHIAQGRDPGPLANPSHYFLLVGIFGAFAAGVIAIFLADDDVPVSGVRIMKGWRAPLGGVLITAGAAQALIGFPMDDVWHRIFGQDVTLWSPTHVMMISGLSLSVVGIIVLSVEGMRVRSAQAAAGSADRGLALVRAFQRVMLPGALLLVLSLLQGEFDYGVPQFRLAFHPMTIMVAAGVGLVAARVFLGRGAALGAAVVFVVIRGGIALLVGPVIGQPHHEFPLYLVEALSVELIALRLGTARAVRLGLVSGAAIGTVGLAAEWGWSNVFAISWPAHLLPQALVLGGAMAVAGSVLGAWLGSHLKASEPVRSVGLRRAAIASCVVIAGLIGYGLVKPAPDQVRAQVALTEVTGAPHRTVNATVTVTPADGLAHADWVRSVAWQGGGLEGAPLREIRPGVWVTTKPLPVYGSWKTAIRFARGAQLSGLPIYLPVDRAIPVAGTPAPPRFTRVFGSEAKVLRREAKDVAPWVWSVSTAIMAFLVLAMMAAWAVALRRLALAAPLSGGSPRRPDWHPRSSRDTADLEPPQAVLATPLP